MRHQATKTESQVQDEEAERLVRPAPKYRPPRRDLRRESIRESDPDLAGSGSDPDLTLNYKNVGGSVVTSPSVMAPKSAVYHGVLDQVMTPYPGPEHMPASKLTLSERSALCQEALEWLPTNAVNLDAGLREALDYAIYTSPFQGSVSASSYESMLGELSRLATTTKGTVPMKTVSASQAKLASQVLETFDKMADYVQANYTKLGMSHADAKRVVNALDRTADKFEVATLGEESFAARQAEVLERDSEEPYVQTFEAPTRVHQSDKDEPYMGLFNDDQTTAVGTGKSEAGKPIAPMYS